jgi:hypothetical protein
MHAILKRVAVAAGWWACMPSCLAADTCIVPESRLVIEQATGDRICPLVFTEGGACTVILSARAAPGFAPEIAVKLDGRNFLSSVVGDDTWTPYSESIDIGPGRRDIRVHAVRGGEGLDIRAVTIVALDGQEPPTVLQEEQYEQDLDARRQEVLDAADRNIASLRKRRLVVRVEGADAVPVAITQRRHAFPFGAVLIPGMFDAAFPEADTRRYLDEVQRLFTAAVPEYRLDWSALEPEAGASEWDALDRMAHWCGVNELAFHGPTLAGPCRTSLPPWVNAGDTATALAAFARFSERMFQRLPKTADFSIGLSPCPDATAPETAVPAADLFLAASRPGRRIIALVRNVEDDATLAARIAALEEFLSRGIPVGGILVEFDGRNADVLRLQDVLDRFASLGLPMKLSLAADVDARTFEHLMRLGFGHAAVEAIYTWGVVTDAWGASSLQATYEALVHEDWRTAVAGRTDARGEVACDAFAGTYDVAVGEGDARVVLDVTVSPTQEETVVESFWSRQRP